MLHQIQASRNTRLQRILEETKITDGEAQIRERMQMLNTQLSDSISNLHEVFTSRTFVAICRGFWDKMGQVRKINKQVGSMNSESTNIYILIMLSSLCLIRL